MSLITFRSPTQGSVIMFREDAHHLLSILSLPESGEITTAEIPEQLSKLKAAIATDKTRNPVIWPEENNPDIDTQTPALIHFSQRATPMVHLMERCLAATETIRWPA